MRLFFDFSRKIGEFPDRVFSNPQRPPHELICGRDIIDFVWNFDVCKAMKTLFFTGKRTSLFWVTVGILCCFYGLSSCAPMFGDWVLRSEPLSRFVNRYCSKYFQHLHELVKHLRIRILLRVYKHFFTKHFKWKIKLKRLDLFCFKLQKCTSKRNQVTGFFLTTKYSVISKQRLKINVPKQYQLIFKA